MKCGAPDPPDFNSVSPWCSGISSMYYNSSAQCLICFHFLLKVTRLTFKALSDKDTSWGEPCSIKTIQLRKFCVQRTGNFLSEGDESRTIPYDTVNQCRIWTFLWLLLWRILFNSSFEHRQEKGRRDLGLFHNCWLWLHKKAKFPVFTLVYTHTSTCEAANYCQIREKSEFFWYLLVQSEDLGLLQSFLCEVLRCVSSKRSQPVVVFSNLQSLWISPLLSHSVLTGMSSSRTVCNSQEMDGVGFFCLKLWI